jgi:hypothetical protein
LIVAIRVPRFETEEARWGRSEFTPSPGLKKKKEEKNSTIV